MSIERRDSVAALSEIPNPSLLFNTLCMMVDLVGANLTSTATVLRYWYDPDYMVRGQLFFFTTLSHESDLYCCTTPII